MANSAANPSFFKEKGNNNIKLWQIKPLKYSINYKRVRFGGLSWTKSQLQSKPIENRSISIYR